MRIESLRRYPGGTRITLWGTEYHFVPDAEDRQVAEVTDPKHIERLLSIPEGFRALDVEAAPVAEIPPAAATLEPEPVDAKEPQGEQAEEESEEAATEGGEDKDRDYWVGQFEAKFGRKPHGRWTIERIRAELESWGE